jgi:hypothetical protein
MKKARRHIMPPSLFPLDFPDIGDPGFLAYLHLRIAPKPFSRFISSCGGLSIPPLHLCLHRPDASAPGFLHAPWKQLREILLISPRLRAPGSILQVWRLHHRPGNPQAAMAGWTDRRLGIRVAQLPACISPSYKYEYAGLNPSKCQLEAKSLRNGTVPETRAGLFNRLR